MKSFWVLSVALLFVFFSNAQTVDEVVNKYMDALGGKEKLLSIKSLHMEGVANNNGNEITTSIYKVQDKLFRSETNFGMGSFKILIVEGKGWSMNPRSGGSFEPMTEEMVKAYQYQMDCTSPLIDYANKGHKAELIGKEEVEGTECYKIKLTLKSGNDVTFYIDTKSYYLIRETTVPPAGMMGGGRGGNAPREMIVNYSNYQKTDDGYMFAMTITRGSGRMGGAMTLEKIEVNATIDEKLYKPE